MCEVTRSSFEQLFPLIEKSIKAADFIAIDSEFTGLTVEEKDKPSLFDTSEERYRKLRSSVSKLSVIQFGVSAFVRDGHGDGYQAHTYNFPLCPKAFGSINPTFTVQASSLDFFDRFNFDFNKSMYEGLSFLNDDQEKELCHMVDSGILFSGLERQFDESFIQALCSKVAEWYVKNKEGQTLTLHKTSANAKLWNDYVIHMEIRKRFPGVWTVTDPFKNVAVEKVSAERRKLLEEQAMMHKEQEQDELRRTMVGFTRVFRVLRECQKPLVGHNLLMDLLFMYDKFFHPLPARYSTFKRDFHELFPKIYDTKHMAFTVKKMLHDVSGIFSTNLIQLYNLINSELVFRSVTNLPPVKHAQGFERYKSKDFPHEAGYDAFLCGFVFIHICHLERFKNNKNILIEYCPIQHYLASVSHMCNRINMIRASLNHITLDDKDPTTTRPQQLYVQCRKKGQRLDGQKLAEWMSSCGTVDIRLLTERTALVATGNFTCVRNILTTFADHQVISVSRYRFWKHSPVARSLMWCGLLTSTGVCVWSIVSLVREHF